MRHLLFQIKSENVFNYHQKEENKSREYVHQRLAPDVNKLTHHSSRRGRGSIFNLINEQRAAFYYITIFHPACQS